MYFQYTFKRATADALDLMFLGGDFFRLLPQFAMDFWYLIFVWIALMWYSNKIYAGFELPSREQVKQDSRKVQIFWLCTILVLSIITGRGGLQLKPIGIINAGLNTSAQNIPLVLNTPFAVMTTLGKDEITLVNFFDSDELSSVYNPVQRFEEDPNAGRPINVVVILMESFSSEYSAVFGDQTDSYTPTLDSLADNGMAYLRCFANGRKSIEGIPAATAGLPNLMHEPYITSVFAGNSINSIAGNLKGVGYATSFYHGGNNGTMGFDAFAQVSGYEQYYGRSEYNQEEHFDGKWGIYDEEFFQYFKAGLDQEQEPFTACFVSLSSHNPYIIPERYDQIFKDGSMPIHKSIQYADFALGRFFKEAAKSRWFDNTLFVITADHSAQAEDAYYKNRVGMYAIPLLFYHPAGALQGLSMRITQQADILPSVLDYVGYGSKFIAFGNSVFDESQAGFAVNYLNGLHQLIQGTYVMHFDGKKTVGLYNYEMDRNLSGNLADKQPEVRKLMERLLKGIIQSYNYRLVNNQLADK
ncbi:MAG: LTA synthase family protein [Flavobacteriales bacterium]|nr:LTA synthase family protein [Flavobacteriales bacterium]